jgi:hypothetical protein
LYNEFYILRRYYMSKTFEELHPDVAAMNKYEITVRRYINTTITGRITEAWELRDDGKWHDVTLREQTIQRAEWEVEAANRELRRMTGAKDEQENC